MDNDDNLVNFADDQADELDQRNGTKRFGDAVLYGTDWTVGTILQQIGEGNIDLKPSFQRRDAWDPLKKCRFIESVVLQLPIPQLVLAERKEQKGTYLVLDGKQRLLTLAQFAGRFADDHDVATASLSPSPLKLSGLKIIPELNGSTYDGMRSTPELKALTTQFENHTIRSALIRNWPDEDYLYEVFIRLNTGSTKLSPQELRQAMKPGKFTRFLDEYSSTNATLRRLLKLDAPDFRMRDVDLLLRMIAFSTRLQEYRGNLKVFLDDTHDFYNNNWADSEQLINRITQEINIAINFLAEQFGDIKHVGRRWMRGEFDSALNRAVLDVQLAVAMNPRNRDAIEGSNGDLHTVFASLCENNPEFVDAISGTTKSISAVRTRFTAWKFALEQMLSINIDLPELPNGNGQI